MFGRAKEKRARAKRAYAAGLDRSDVLDSRWVGEAGDDERYFGLLTDADLWLVPPGEAEVERVPREQIVAGVREGRRFLFEAAGRLMSVRIQEAEGMPGFEDFLE